MDGSKSDAAVLEENTLGIPASALPIIIMSLAIVTVGLNPNITVFLLFSVQCFRLLCKGRSIVCLSLSLPILVCFIVPSPNILWRPTQVVGCLAPWWTNVAVLGIASWLKNGTEPDEKDS